MKIFYHNFLHGQNLEIKFFSILDVFALWLFKRQPYKMVKYTQSIHGLLATTCLSVLDHFAELALKVLTLPTHKKIKIRNMRSFATDKISNILFGVRLPYRNRLHHVESWQSIFVQSEQERNFSLNIYLFKVSLLAV